MLTMWRGSTSTGRPSTRQRGTRSKRIPTLSQTIKNGEFTSVPKLCPGCQESDLFGDLQNHPLFQTNVTSWTLDIEVFQEKLIEAVNTHIVSCPYLTKMGELIPEMKDSVDSEDRTDKSPGSPKMNPTQQYGCDNNEAVYISSTSESEYNKDDRKRDRRRNKKIFKKFAIVLESSRESIMEADREAKALGRMVLEHLECPICFAPSDTQSTSDAAKFYTTFNSVFDKHIDIDTEAASGVTETETGSFELGGARKEPTQYNASQQF